jgi:hypothetical protein
MGTAPFYKLLGERARGGEAEEKEEGSKRYVKKVT